MFVELTCKELSEVCSVWFKSGKGYNWKSAEDSQDQFCLTYTRCVVGIAVSCNPWSHDYQEVQMVWNKKSHL